MQVPGCLNFSHALRVGLVLEHVGVAALLAEVHREGVARPHGLEARVLLEARLGHDRARVGLGGRVRKRLAAAVARALLVHGPQVGVVLEREVLAPDRRVLGLVVQLHHAEEGVPGLLLALHDVHEQRGHGRGGQGGAGRDREDRAARRRRAAARRGLSHGLPPVAGRWWRTAPGAPPSRGSGCTRCPAEPAWAGVPMACDHGLVAAPAVRLRDRPAPGRGADGLVKAAGREVVRVPEAVPGLRVVLAHEVVRHVAVVADRHRAVAAFVQPSYCSFITWQFAQARASSVR